MVRVGKCAILLLFVPGLLSILPALGAEIWFPVSKVLRKKTQAYAYLVIDPDTGAIRSGTSFTFALATPFDGERAVVRLRAEAGESWAIIDRSYPVTGKPIAWIRGFESVAPLSEGFAVVRTGAYPVERYGLIDAEGRVVLEPKYMGLGDVRQGKIAFSEGQLWGYLAHDPSSGAFVQIIAPKYRRAEPFSGGFAAVSTEVRNASGHIARLAYFIDSTGKQYGPYRDTHSFDAQGFAAAQDCRSADCVSDPFPGGTGIVSAEKIMEAGAPGWVLPPGYRSIDSFVADGLAFVNFSSRPECEVGVECDPDGPWVQYRDHYSLVNFSLLAQTAEVIGEFIWGFGTVRALSADRAIVGEDQPDPRYSLIDARGRTIVSGLEKLKPVTDRLLYGVKRRPLGKRDHGVIDLDGKWLARQELTRRERAVQAWK